MDRDSKICELISRELSYMLLKSLKKRKRMEKKNI